MTGTTLSTFCSEINGGDTINATLLTQFVGIGKALVEQRRPWMLLRKTDTSKTVTTANTWQTQIDLSTLTRFNRFYGKYPIRLFDGVQTTYRYHQVPFEERLENLTRPDTFVYDEANQKLYLNGIPPFAGTLYLHYIQDTVDPTLDDSWTWSFPSWSHALLGLMAVGINKGGVDYDDIHARMAPDNRALAEQITKMLEAWDTEKQITAIEDYDENDIGSMRANAININA
jgi:hypothetical protein